MFFSLHIFHNNDVLFTDIIPKLKKKNKDKSFSEVKRDPLIFKTN